jgi:hypothetical protein
VEVCEQVLRLSRRGAQLRPFCTEAAVQHRGYSRRLQRVLVDFGAEGSFQAAVLRVQEHYGISVAAAAVRRQTFKHGRAINAVPVSESTVPGLITQMDGSMIPVMEPGHGPDRRTGKKLYWREVRLCSARAKGQVQPVYGATLGSAETASWLWRQTAQAGGLGPKTFVHGVGDGACWIVDKFEENFGEQGAYLIDFYHVSQYLAGAAASISRTGKEKQWLRRQQGGLLNNQVAKVLRALFPHQEDVGVEEAPVRVAYGYLQERRHHLDYAGARHQGLPIGSGEIESGHRHVVQQRLKLSGCWWKESNAHSILNLRVARANHLWNSYWSSALN